MVGGTKEAVAVAEPVFLALAPEGGYAHVGPPGAGHFVKMVHNGIEYGLMQAYAEGFEIMSEAARVRPRPPRDRLDLALRLGGAQLAPRAGRAGAAARVRASTRSRGSSSTRARGAGRWTRPSTAACRPRSSPRRCSPASPRRRRTPSASGWSSALRNQFGGHAFTTADGTQGGETFTPR